MPLHGPLCGLFVCCLVLLLLTSVTLCQDAFTFFGRHDARTHNDEVVAATRRLREHVVPSLASDLLRVCDPIDVRSCETGFEFDAAVLSDSAAQSALRSDSGAEAFTAPRVRRHAELTGFLHSRGVNMRYLLLLRQHVVLRAASEAESFSDAAEKTAFLAAGRRIAAFLLTSAAARALRHELHRLWVAASSAGLDELKRVTARFLNTLFSTEAGVSGPFWSNLWETMRPRVYVDHVLGYDSHAPLVDLREGVCLPALFVLLVNMASIDIQPAAFDICLPSLAQRSWVSLPAGISLVVSFALSLSLLVCSCSVSQCCLSPTSKPVLLQSP